MGIEAYRKGLAPRTDGRLIELACKDVSKALSERGTALDESTDELRKLMRNAWSGCSSAYTGPRSGPAIFRRSSGPFASSSAAVTFSG
ncbi:hypothetical protein ACFQL8_12240 [Streptomyces goshikiensis]|uniref:hypothetical protein n=1 Tax=Streptomyces goshikiensis TaxID=1942 RepID=UPI001677172B|nr:hypothetical protein [Streptomyces goshikiensis]GHD80535.1 hypothetical protein GCM10010336_64280 [Streptomyces goshikiensis]